MTIENDILEAVRRYRTEANLCRYAHENHGNNHGVRERWLVAEARYSLAVRYALRNNLTSPWMPRSIRARDRGTDGLRWRP